MGYLS
jgi:hypothetical protein